LKTGCFDAEIDFSSGSTLDPGEILVLYKKRKIPGSFSFLEPEKIKIDSPLFVNVSLDSQNSLYWKDEFKLLDRDSRAVLAAGIILDPKAEEVKKKGLKKRITFLKSLKEEKTMLLSLADEKGIKGLHEREILEFCDLPVYLIQKQCEDLEKDGLIKILSFSPVFLLSQSGFNFFCQKLLSYLDQFHKKHPNEMGISSEKIKKRYDLSSKIFSLTVRHLIRSGKIREYNGLVSLISFRVTLTRKEEEQLRELEEMSFKGDLSSVSMKDLQKQFGLSPAKLDMMLSLLVERKRIIKGKDGFMVHSPWLDELILKIRSLDKKELTVTDFKNMTGLSRKYAIPLLELLDQKGVTRRTGSTRKILF
jgi:selenocysteine-specific elongation factor